MCGIARSSPTESPPTTTAPATSPDSKSSTLPGASAFSLHPSSFPPPLFPDSSFIPPPSSFVLTPPRPRAAQSRDDATKFSRLCGTGSPRASPEPDSLHVEDPPCADRRSAGTDPPTCPPQSRLPRTGGRRRKRSRRWRGTPPLTSHSSCLGPAVAGLTPPPALLAFRPLPPYRTPWGIDEALVSEVRGQPGAPSTLRLGLQPGELPAASGPAIAGKGLTHWSLTTLLEKLIKIGAKVITHARYVIFQMAEVAVPRRLFDTILRRIRSLRTLVPVPT